MVVKIEIKLVGGVSDIKDISEIENIAKVFVIEHRISNLNPIKNTKNIINNKSQISYRNKNNVNGCVHKKSTILTVRGFK